MGEVESVKTSAKSSLHKLQFCQSWYLDKEAIFDMIATKRRRKEIKIYHRNQGRGDRVEDDREMAGEPVRQTEAAHATDVLWSRTFDFYSLFFMLQKY